MLIWYIYEWENGYEAINWSIAIHTNHKKLFDCINNSKNWILKIFNNKERIDLMSLDNETFQKKAKDLFDNYWK